MKNIFKINGLLISLAMLVPIVAGAADASGGAERPTPEQRAARMAACKADPEKCRTEFQARREQWCSANPERCKQMQARMQQHRAECKADPGKCRAERQVRFEQRFKAADADGNGMISRGEAEKAMPRLLHHFERIDADHDGQITRDEIAAARKARDERHPRRMDRPTI